jgi:Ca2+-binding EF-hand superfamily protein
MSNRQFWSFLNLEFIYTTTFGKIFYQIICEFNEPTKLEYMKFLDLKKFMQFVSIFTKNLTDHLGHSLDLRKKFLFRLFDIDNSEEVDKLEFRNFLTAFLEMILTCNFENETIQNKIKHLRSEATNVQLIEKALDQYVEEVYNNTYDGYVMTYEEWEKWIVSIEGIYEINKFIGSLPSLAGHIG